MTAPPVLHQSTYSECADRDPDRAKEYPNA